MTPKESLSGTVLFHIPHDGSPPGKKEHFIDCKKVGYYHTQMSDLHVTGLLPEGYESVKFPYSRLVCDVERKMGPEEPMEKYGMGFFYTRVYDGTVIREEHCREDWDREARIHYAEHHEQLNRFCREHPRVFLIDLHSYHDVILLPEFLEEGRKTPDLCIGTDPRFTPPELAEYVREKFEAAGFTTDMNYPYAGCYIPESVEDGSSWCGFIGMMLEFHRRTYLDGINVNPEKAEKIRKMIREVAEKGKCLCFQA